MTTRNFALIFGFVFLLVGIAGFMPALVTPVGADHPHLAVDAGYGLLFGLFAVNVVHNVVHLAFGVWGILAARSLGAAKVYARLVAIAYAVLTVAGLVAGFNTLFGFAPLFGHDVWLHGLIALAAAYFGWVHRDAARAFRS
jgi:hypothetical protein